MRGQKYNYLAAESAIKSLPKQCKSAGKSQNKY